MYQRPANLLFRSLFRERAAEYWLFGSDACKGEVLQEGFRSVLDSGGRFLKEESCGHRTLSTKLKPSVSQNIDSIPFSETCRLQYPKGPPLSRHLPTTMSYPEK